MTGDPERLLNAKSTAGPLERELLTTLRSTAPPEGAEERVWRDVTRNIALIGAVGTGASLTATTTASAAQAGAFAITGAKGVLASKLVVLLGVGLGAASVGAAWIIAQNEPAHEAQPAVHRAVPVAPTSTPALHSEAKLEPPPCLDDSCREAHAADKPSPRRTATRAERADLLARESALLIRARSELRGGDVSAAQATLAALESDFPRGMLAQEREVLRIELLAAKGDLAGARRRAKAFVRAHPKSPHSVKLSRFSNAP
jgi:hypothetical protein